MRREYRSPKDKEKDESEEWDGILKFKRDGSYDLKIENENMMVNEFVGVMHIVAYDEMKAADEEDGDM